MAGGTKKRGRPPRILTEEQQKERDTRRKAMAVKRQQKYAASHPEKIKALRQSYYDPKVRVPVEHKATIEALVKKTGLSFSQLCMTALEEKYGVTLRKTVNKDKK